jgi:hypothetical protein
MQRLKIDVKKIDKTALYSGAKGTYLDITLLDNRDGNDQYGNDGMIVQDIGQARREAGEKGPILGNWKWIGKQVHQAEPTAHEKAKQDGYAPAKKDDSWIKEPVEDDSDVPF